MEPPDASCIATGERRRPHGRRRAGDVGRARDSGEGERGRTDAAVGTFVGAGRSPVEWHGRRFRVATHNFRQIVLARSRTETENAPGDAGRPVSPTDLA